MLARSDLARIISDRFKLRGGKRIPIYLGEWMIDYVFEAIKIGLIEDGVVNIKNCVAFRRLDIPAHDHLMPDGSYVKVPDRARIKADFKRPYLDGLHDEEVKELDYDTKW